ncbi:hypothetical protein P3S67_019298 [Capsicum chacoense]|uniref:uncharacterized protein LOC107839866 n=1 Tax=Capsicum annuum TaxID=4072 RepID=UPI001FB06BED|nr:uncharacterized protein LOC107839866 [Capsicum annuum]KAF3618872.1 putative leucine-rich repeat receptor-like serine/threonine-protein kinase BAM1-like [Capsicum annuum]KAF3680453.1 putative leucine-rich repeat receptor-like serine/threonine-protein kinase BAM1-like [Capsicum annuum]
MDMNMSERGSERSNTWNNIHTSSEPSPSQTQVNREGQWKNYGTSMDAISFGFVATAILISMFLIMALFEHLFKPSTPFSSPRGSRHSSMELGTIQKRASSIAGPTRYSSEYTVLMPGQQYPTFIAKPTPLSCPREGVYWPSHEHGFPFS